MSSIFSESTRQGALWVGLRKLGYRIEEATINDSLLIRIVNPDGGVWLSGKKMSYPMNSREVYELANDKRASYALAQSIGIRTPRSLYVSADSPLDDAVQFVSQFGLVVVKPLDGYKSHGVSLNITNQEQLERALNISYEESPTAIIQEQIEGEEYRFSVLNGKVVSVLRRERPQVKGDGESTIEQLVQRENTARQLLPDTVIPYPQWTAELLGDAVFSQDVLAAGEIRLLSNTTLVSKGASVYELLDNTHESYHQLAESFAGETGAGFVAIDMFILDHTRPAAEGNYWFNECNASPSLKMYSTPRNASVKFIAEEVINTTAKHLKIL